MTGGTLILTRAVKLHNFYKKHLEEIGFKNIYITDVDRDALNMIIQDIKPSLLMIEACFYGLSTPYMMIELLEKFPKLNIAAVNMYDYPDEKAKYFILNGVNSYVSLFEGIEEFYKGLLIIRDGKSYISPNVIECINKTNEFSKQIKSISGRENEVLEQFCSGKKEIEIARILQISKNTVQTHRQNLYRMFNVENKMQLFWAALAAGKVRFDKSFYFIKNNSNIKGGINDC